MTYETSNRERWDTTDISPKTIGAVTDQLKITPVNTQAKVSPENVKYTVSKADFDKLVSFSEQAIIKDRARWQDAWDREIAPMIFSGVLGLLMAFIAYGRMVLKPLQ